ncbi:MAG TPA: DinB family protein [Parafilimonas sp.]|jgi:uncharacterized damage-inducible protein DinB
MKITSLIAQHIKEVYEGNNWTDVNIAETIKDLSYQQAQQQTAASKNTIAALLHHLYYWNGIIMQRSKEINPFIPETNGFDVDEFKNENDWQRLKEKTHESFIQLTALVENFPEEKLEETYAEGKSSYYKNFQGIVEHAHYHLGQMVILKKLLK